MDFEPVVFQVEPPHQNFLQRLPKLPKIGPRGTKILIAVSAIVISITLVGVVLLSILVSNNHFRQSHGLNINPQDQKTEQNGTTKSAAAQPGGGIAVGVGHKSGADSPDVTFTGDPATVTQGGKATLKWSTTKNPTCTASDDWSGTKATSGSEQTPTLDKIQTYLFTLTCKTKTGTNASTVAIAVTEKAAANLPAGVPVVSISSPDSSVYTGTSATIIWSSTNGATSCTASGDWSGIKSASGSQAVGPLSTARQYKFELSCSNSSGTSQKKTATVLAQDPPPGVPIVTISSTPGSPVTPGTVVTLNWSTTNTPATCTASGDWSGAKAASGSQNLGALNTIKTYTYTITCSNSTDASYDAVAIAVIPDPPNVSLTATPSSIYVGRSATLNWSATNSPTSCTASGDWTGAKSASGSQSTGNLNTVKTYYYTLTCQNAGGTGYARNVPVTVTNPPAPVVSLSVSPIATTVGGSANLTWSATNSPTSCTASGDWTGAKSSSGTQSTGTLGSARTYTYTLVCSNAGGSDSATTSVSVAASGPSSAPVVSVSLASSTIGTGSSTTINWSATNSPTSCTASGSWSGGKSSSGSQGTGTMNTAGTYTYSLSCTNSVGTSSDSATLTVLATPTISLSVSPSSINTGSSATIAWSVTNSPSSCTAGGSWSGSKAASGSQSTGTMNTAGTYTYTLSCTNSGGTTSKSASLTVANAAPVYCGGKTPCYGPSDLASHASVGNCWGWNIDWVINITSFRPSHPGGIKSGSTSTIENATATCNHNIASILSGSAGISGYRDSSGATTHNHQSSTKNNSGSSQLSSYRVGYYDASKP